MILNPDTYYDVAKELLVIFNENSEPLNRFMFSGKKSLIGVKDVMSRAETADFGTSTRVRARKRGQGFHEMTVRWVG